MKQRVNDLRTRYLDFARAVGAPDHIVSFRESPSHTGAPHVEYEGSDLCFVVTERGCEFERRRTKDPDTLMYWLLSDLTFQMACDYESRFRRKDEDFRRQLFEKQLDLLGSLKPEWRERRKGEIRSVLEKNPFTDKKEANQPAEATEAVARPPRLT